jgi:hypothetical protein
LTLGVVLTLGGVTGGRGQELSGSLAAASAPSSGAFVLPTLPENWADLPFQLTASQTVSYNSNINAIPIGFALPGQVLGDFTTTTNVGFSTKANVYGQQVYLDTTFGVIRYLHEVEFDSDVYSISAGVNWTLTSRCSGTLGVVLDKSPVEITASVATSVGTGVNYGTTTAFNETGRCAVSNGYSLLFNTGWNELTNSNPIDALNNTRSTMLSAGIEYAKGASTVTALASNSDTIRSVGAGAVETVVGLADVTDFHSFTLTYARQINPNLSVNGLIGLVGTTGAFTLGLPKTLLPIYTLGTTWSFTPKLLLNASASKTVAPPTTIIANAQTTYVAQMSLAYQWTPKVAVNVGGSISYASGAFTPAAVTVTVPGLPPSSTPFLTGASDFYSVNAGLTYAMTPFLSAALNASYTERVTDHTITPEDLVIVSLRYSPF